MNILQFVYSPVVEHLGCFQFLPIRSESYWGYFCTRLFVDLVFSFLEKYLTVELQVPKQMDTPSGCITRRKTWHRL